MADRGGEFSIFQGIHVRFDTRIDISRFGKQVHLQDLTQTRLIKQVLVKPITSRSRGKLEISPLPYCLWLQTWQDDNLL